MNKCTSLMGCQYPNICKHRQECYWIKGADDGKAASVQAQEGLGVEAAGPAAQAALLLAQSNAAARLCVGCKHYSKSGLNPFLKLCGRPGLPLNLVTGHRRFPAIIARGYDHLCGWQGRYWEQK